MSLSRRRFLSTLLTSLAVAPLAARRVMGAPVKAPSQMVDGCWTDNPAWLYYDALHPTSVTVQWTDPARQYTPQLVHVEDREKMTITGYRHVFVPLPGCLSEAQATRHARWLLTVPS